MATVRHVIAAWRLERVCFASWMPACLHVIANVVRGCLCRRTDLVMRCIARLQTDTECQPVLGTDLGVQRHMSTQIVVTVTTSAPAWVIDSTLFFSCRSVDASLARYFVARGKSWHCICNYLA